MWEEKIQNTCNYVYLLFTDRRQAGRQTGGYIDTIINTCRGKETNWHKEEEVEDKEKGKNFEYLQLCLPAFSCHQNI